MTSVDTTSTPAAAPVPSSRLHPIYLLTETARTVRRAIPFLVVTVLGGAPWAVNAVLFVLIMAVAVAEWSIRRYSVTGGLFRLSGGLLHRTERTIPLSRITSVVAGRSVTQRLVGTWSLRIGVPGDRRGALVTLPSLSTGRMTELRDALSGPRSPGPSPTSDPGDPNAAAEPDGTDPDSRDPAGATGPPVLLARLSVRALLISAATSALIPLLIAAALVGWARFSRFVPRIPRTFMQTAVEPRGQDAVTVLLVVIGLVAALGWTVVRQYGFTLHRDGPLLRTAGGLLLHRTAAVESGRIHAVRIVEGLWRGLLGYCALQVEVAGMGRVDPVRRSVFPLLRTDAVASLVDAAVPQLGWRPAPLHRVPRSLHRRYLTVPVAWAAGLAIAGTGVLWLAGAGAAAFGAFVLVPVGAGVGLARAREAAWYLDGDVLVLRSRRVLTRQTVVARRGGIELARQHASVFNARRGVAGITVRFSSGRSATVPYLPVDVVRELLQAVHAVHAVSPPGVDHGSVDPAGVDHGSVDPGSVDPAGIDPLRVPGGGPDAAYRGR